MVGCTMAGACSSDPAADDAAEGASEVGGIHLDDDGPGVSPSGGADGADGADAADGEGGVVRLDVREVMSGGDPSGGDCSGSGGSGQGGNSFSIIWIANSAEGTVSKIDTQSATELARYRTGPGESDPSRTSVNLLGDVAIANRSGSVTKIASALSRCVDLDGDGAITTSSGPDDILGWGEDECVLWHHETDFSTDASDNQGGPRAIAWDGGSADVDPCTNRPNLWFGWRNQPTDDVIIRRLDGADGTVLDEVVVEDWACQWNHGVYGGAADREGGFWALGSLGTLVHVDPVTLEVSRWDNPVSHTMYGLALDAEGTPWLAGYEGNLWKFDRTSNTFVDLGDTLGGPSVLRGLMIDANGTAWIAGNRECALVKFDTRSETIVDSAIPLPGCAEPVGVSIDIDGMVWVVDREASVAYRVDPADNTSVVVEGLVRPYTYSDMTGAGLNLVVNPPIG